MVVCVIAVGDSPRCVAHKRLVRGETSRVRRRIIAARGVPHRDGDVHDEWRVLDVVGDDVVGREGAGCSSGSDGGDGGDGGGGSSRAAAANVTTVVHLPPPPLPRRAATDSRRRTGGPATGVTVEVAAA
jgi:hypothetical protein